MPPEGLTEEERKGLRLLQEQKEAALHKKPSEQQKRLAHMLFDKAEAPRLKKRELKIKQLEAKEKAVKELLADNFDYKKLAAKYAAVHPTQNRAKLEKRLKALAAVRATQQSQMSPEARQEAQQLLPHSVD